MNLIVFDIDGTLTKSENQHQTAFISALNEFGVTEINKNWTEYQHLTDTHILKVNYEKNLNKPFDISIISAIEKRMHEQLTLMPGVTEIKGASNIIDYFTNHSDYAIAFATGSLLQPALLKLNQAGIKVQEDLVVGSNSIFERENIVREAIERAKKYNQVSSFDAVISIGDGIWDLKTARNLNFPFIGIGEAHINYFQKENIKMHIKDWTDFDLSLVEKTFGIG